MMKTERDPNTYYVENDIKSLSLLGFFIMFQTVWLHFFVPGYIAIIPFIIGSVIVARSNDISLKRHKAFHEARRKREADV